MERAIRRCRQNDGRKAYLIFGDLDHLKEINDCFGHSAGDFAISNAAKYLQELLPSEAITARIGGDEFVSLVLSEESEFKEKIKKHLKTSLTIEVGNHFMWNCLSGSMGFSAVMKLS